MNNKIFVVLILTTVVIFAGCISTGDSISKEEKNALVKEVVAMQETTQGIADSKVATLDLFLPSAKNWDADAELDGIEVTVVPKSISDVLVLTDGTLSSTLWRVPDMGIDGNGNFVSCEDYIPREKDKIAEWRGIEVREEDYGLSGANVRLEYPQTFKPTGMAPQGYLKVTFKTPDGKSFDAVNCAFLK